MADGKIARALQLQCMTCNKMDRLENAVDGSDRDAIQSALNVGAKLLPLDHPELKVARHKLQEIDANSARYRYRAFLEVCNLLQG
jgi:hypothetical protein